MSPAVLGCLLALAAGAPTRARADAGDERRADRLVAVALFQKAPSVTFMPVGRFKAVDQSSGELVTLKSGAEYKVEAERGKDGRSKLLFGPHLFGGAARLIPGNPDEHVAIGERRYRGNLLFRPNSDGTLTVVDELGLEEYLFGVLPHEMSPEWSLEALKAQAVVSRTYALGRLGRGADDAFDLTDDAYTQVYTGVTTESEHVRKAVRATQGRVLTYLGKPLPGFFHSTCGGHTAGAAEVWGGEDPKPLRGVRDRWCKVSPHFKWGAYFANSDILAALNRNGFTAARLLDVREGDRGSAGWLTNIRVKTDRGWKRVPANKFRLWLGPRDLKSVRFDSVRRRRKGFEFEGRGYGHGVGLCQWGARAQADAGHSFEEILGHYFPGASLSKMRD